MHKLRLRTRSAAAAASDAQSSKKAGTRSPGADEAGSSASVFGRSSTSTSTSTSTTGRSSSNAKGKGKEASNGQGANGGAGGNGGLKASLRGMKKTKKSMQTSSSNGAGSANGPSGCQPRPQLTLPTDNDFRASLILPELTRRFTLLRGKDGSLVPFDKMQAHLRVQRENGRLTETEEELVLRQYRLQSIYEAAQPDDIGSAASAGFLHTSPSTGGLVALPEEKESPYSSRAPSRANIYTPEPSTPSLSSPTYGEPYSFYATSSSNSHSGMLASPEPMVTSSSLSSSPLGTPIPVSTVGFASSSAAEFYAARDAVLKGGGLFGGGGLEREIQTKLHASPSTANLDSVPSTPGTPGRRYRSKRYTTTAASNIPGSDTDSQHSLANDGQPVNLCEGSQNGYAFMSAIPPIPRIVKQQEEEYDPYRPKDDSDASEPKRRKDDSESVLESSEMAAKVLIPPHLDVPMSRRQIHRISRALQDIEAELARTYDFVGEQDEQKSENGFMSQEGEQSALGEHSYEHDYDYTPSDEEGGYNSSYDYSRNARNNFRHDDGEGTFHSFISADESTSSEYHHQHSDRAPFVYDDTDEIDPGLSRLPSQHVLDSRNASALGNDERLYQEGGLHITNHGQEVPPRIQFSSEGTVNLTEEEESSRHDSLMSDGTRLSDSTTTPNETGHTPRSATTSTSTLDVIVDGDEGAHHNLLHQSNNGSLQAQDNGNISRLSASSGLSKAASSPGLPYLRATPPIQSSEFTLSATPAANEPSANNAGVGVVESGNVGGREASPATNSSESSGSANMRPSTSGHTLSSVTTSYSGPRLTGMSRSTSMTRLASNTSSTDGGTGGSILPKNLQQEFALGHSRDTSAASSIAYHPPLSPPPQCGLPPLPSSASGHSLASLGQRSMHSNMPSVASVTLMSPSTSGQGANMGYVEQEDQLSEAERVTETGDRTDEVQQVLFPKYPETAPIATMGAEDQPGSEHQDRNRHDSLQSSSDGSERGTHRYSNTSTGSSWRGGPGGHTRNLSTSTVDFDLPPISPTSKGGSHRPMTNIEEDIDEDEVFSSERQDEERRKAMEYLCTHAPGLEMSDLRAIQERLVQSALQQGDPDALSGNEAAHEVSAETGDNRAQHRMPQSTAVTSDLFALEGEPAMAENNIEQNDALLASSTGNAKLGSPFMEQDGFAEQQNTSQNTGILPTLSEEEEGGPCRNSINHPAETTPRPERATETRGDAQQSQGRNETALHSGAASPAIGVAPSSSPDGVHSVRSNPSSPRPPQPTSTPSSTLRPRRTRNSNSTPSMLIRQVHQQASEATAALKSPFTDQPNSPDEALWRLANMPARRTLSHRKSAKSLKIGTPQLVSSSANLEHMPMVDTLNIRAPLVNGHSKTDISNTRRSPSTSPEVSRKTSVAGYKFKMGFKNRGAGGHDESNTSTSTDHSTASADLNSPSVASSGNRHLCGGSFDNSPSSGIRQLVAKLRRRKMSSDVPDKLIPDPLVLRSPDWSSPKELHDPLSPGAASLTGQFGWRLGEGPPSISSRGTDTMADVRPLEVDKSASSDKLSALAINTGDSNGSSPSTFGNLAAKESKPEAARASATSLDSMRKLFEAATALGLDADRVNELVDAAGYRQSFQAEDSANPVVRSTVILAPSNDSYFPPMDSLAMARSISGTSSNAAPSMPRSMSGTSIGRLRSTKSVRNRNASVGSLAMSINGADRTVKHGEAAASNGSFSDANGSGNRKSIHDRPATPPPDKKTSHRRQRSDAQAAEMQLPTSAEMPTVAMTIPPIQRSHPQYPSMAQHANARDDLGIPAPAFARHGKDSRASYMSSKTSGSYDARSIYGLYGDEDEEIPPTPGISDMNMVLASGRIPGSSSASQRASVLLAPGVSAKRLSTASRNSRIELSEYANGDIAFNIVQSLRRPQGTGDGERGTYYPMDLHRRQNSDNSVEEELNALVASVNASPESDPLKLMIKRHMKEQNKSPTITANAAMETIAHLQSLHPAGRQRSASSATQASSARSVFEVYEAQDESQVAALIEELTKGLDEGHFNLARNDSVARAAMRKSPASRNLQSPVKTKRQDDPASSPRPGAPVQRTPSKIKRQPPPTI